LTGVVNWHWPKGRGQRFCYDIFNTTLRKEVKIKFCLTWWHYNLKKLGKTGLQWEILTIYILCEFNLQGICAWKNRDSNFCLITQQYDVRHRKQMWGLWKDIIEYYVTEKKRRFIFFFFFWIVLIKLHFIYFGCKLLEETIDNDSANRNCLWFGIFEEAEPHILIIN
jgi:hypothetical protein